MLTLQVRGAECVVMAGDPQQLPPTLQSDGALDAQFDRTLFDRLQEVGAGVLPLDASLLPPHSTVMQMSRLSTRHAGGRCRMCALSWGQPGSDTLASCWCMEAWSVKET